MPSSPLVKLGLQAEEIEHLRQRQRDHGEVDALPADSEETDDRAKKRGSCDTDENAEFRRQPPFLHRMGGEIGGAAEEGRVSEGQEAGVTEQQVEGAGKEREAQQLHQEYGIEEQRGEHQQRKTRRQEDRLCDDRLLFPGLIDIECQCHIKHPGRRGLPAVSGERWP